MSLRIFKRPDGRFSVFSGTVDGFLLDDVAPEEACDWFESTAFANESTYGDKMADALTCDYARHGPQDYEEAVELADRT